MKIKNILTIIVLAICFIMLLAGNSNAYSPEVTASIGDKAYLDKGTRGFYTIQKKKDDGSWIYVTYSIIKYNDDNGDEHIAYCLDENKFGVGYVKGDVDGYEVQLTEFFSNEKVWRAIINGFPYKTPEELGVETEDDAYLATKRAIYCLVKGYTVEDVLENYRVGQTAINNQSLEDIQRRGEKVIKAICDLVEIGNNGKQTISNELKIQKVGEFVVDETGDFYYQKYKVVSNVDIKEYVIESISDFPDGTKLVDMNGQERTTFVEDEEFCVIIPKEKIISQIEGNISISAKCKIYPVYFGKAPDGYQDYAICSGYWDKLYANTSLKIDTDISQLEILKIDAETKEPLVGAKFEIVYEDEIFEMETNKDGIIRLENLNPGKITIREIKAPNGYLLNESEKDIEILYNDNIVIEIENSKIPEEPEEPEIPEIPLPRTGDDGIILKILIFILFVSVVLGIGIFLLVYKKLD